MDTKRSTRRATKKVVRVVKAKKPPVSKEQAKEIRKIAKAEIHREAENNSKQSLMLAQQFYYPAATSFYDSANTIAVSPNTVSLDIQQGTAQGARVGNEIRIRKLMFNSVFVPLEYNGTTNSIPQPHVVKLVLFYMKGDPTATPAPRTDFFEFNSTSSAITGTLVDMAAPYNKKKYVILAEKIFKLGYSTFTGSGSAPSFGNFSNNDFLLNKIIKWDITKYIPKIVKYQDNVALPVTRGLWCQVLLSPASGNSGAATTLPVEAQYWLDCEYEDM